MKKLRKRYRRFIKFVRRRLYGLTVESEISSGTYSRVYRGTWRESLLKKQKVAVKVIDHSDVPEQFLRVFLPEEIRISRKMIHPNLVNVFLHFSTMGETYLVSQLASCDLLVYIKKKGFHISYIIVV